MIPSHGRGRWSTAGSRPAAGRTRRASGSRRCSGPLAGDARGRVRRHAWSATARRPTSPLADAIAAWLAELDPDAALVPIVMAGFSDSHWFRKAFDAATVYGFCPQRELDLFAGRAADPRRRRARRGRRHRARGDFYAGLCRRVLA